MCYGKTAFTPGRFLEDGLRKVGVAVDVWGGSDTTPPPDLGGYDAVLYVESPSRPPATIPGFPDPGHGHRPVKIPRLFWVHHGANRLQANLALCGEFRPDLVLMAHSLELAPHFPAPVRFFPFAVATDFFNCTRPLAERKLDIAFVGSTSEGVYNRRRAVLRAIQSHFKGRANISLYAKVYLHKLAALYGNAKIVVNCAADKLRTINMRLFEGIGCGALVLTDLVPHQDRLFEDGKHYVVYDDIDDLIQKLDYYLTHLDEAQAIASDGHRHLLAHHTYEIRARELCAIVEELRAK